MRAGIHPEYDLATVRCSCGNEFQTRSTKPELHVEICSECHPFYTGKQKLVDTGGRVERFQRRLEKAGGAAQGLDLDEQQCRDRRPGRAGRRDDARPGSLGARRSQAGRRDRRGQPADPLRMTRHWVFRLPIIRGVIALGESLAIGFRALAISANYAAQEEGDDGESVETELSRGALIFAFAIAIGFALMLFKVTPALITSWLPIETTGWFVIVEGVIRVGLFVGYLLVISLLPDLRRVFEYHAAEHKVINAYEAGEELVPERVQKFSLIHPRCGTAFLLWVMVIAIFVFAFLGRPRWPG